MPIKLDESAVTITVPDSTKYNMDLMMDLTIVLASRHYWDINGKAMYKIFHKKYKNVKKSSLDNSMGELSKYEQYKDLCKIKTAIDFFKDKSETDILDLQFKAEMGKPYNKYITRLFVYRKIMWI